MVFSEDVVPNHRKLAREFVLFDNFYATGDTSADGLNWSTAAVANDFVEKLWPSAVGRRLTKSVFQGQEVISFPPAGYLWSNAQSAGLNVRNYGLFPNSIDEGMAFLSARGYPVFDLSVPDGERVNYVLADWRRMEQAGELPALTLIHLPNDHTAGRSSGYPTARAMMAEHDDALGRLVQGISESSAWESTAIFVIEDDAQDGADHIDSHRSVALIASPYAKRGVVDSTFYSTPSVLRTIELILGLRPMTQFDAASVPLWRSFTPDPDVAPYEAEKPRQAFDEVNPAGATTRPRRVENVNKPRADRHLALF